MSFKDHYQQIKAIAHRELERHQRNSINTTALVHEAYVKLAGLNGQIESERHQINLVAGAMRHILVDAARARSAEKRGGDLVKITLDASLIGNEQFLDLLALDQALQSLQDIDPRMAKVFELHFFAGADLTEIATELDLNVRTVQRDWQAARAILAAQL